MAKALLQMYSADMRLWNSQTSGLKTLKRCRFVASLNVIDRQQKRGDRMVDIDEARKGLCDSNIYLETYFRVEAGYVWNKGYSDEQGQRFRDEVVGILSPLGFGNWKRLQDRHGGCPECWRGAERLYCHPMNISGELIDKHIAVVEEALRKASSFQVKAVDTYKQFLNYTAEELLRELNACREGISKAMFDSYRTKNRYRYIGFHTSAWYAAFIPHWGKDASSLHGVYADFCAGVLDDLVRVGLVECVPSKGMSLYRSLNVTERKVWERQQRTRAKRRQLSHVRQSASP